MAPNIAKPMTKLMAQTSVKVRIRNSRSGSTGSAARRSARTNAAVSTAPRAASPTTGAEAHGQVVPPREATSTRQAATEAIRNVPR